jgi:hypothetical protein
MPIEVDQRQFASGASAPHPPRQFGPRLLLDLVDRRRELFDLGRAPEAAQEIARRGRVWYSACSNQPPHRLACLQRPQILQTGAVGVQRVGQG